MFSRFLTCLTVCSMSCGLVASAYGSVIYNESVSGDLSNSGLTPTVVTLAAGSNQIFGASGRDASGIDRDYFSVTVPSGFALTSITVLPGTSVAGAFSFIGVQTGAQVTVSTAATDATGLLGWDHYGAADINVNILPAMGVSGLGASGFVPPLRAGEYAFWVQEFSTGVSPYAFDLELGLVPEPGTVALTLAGLAALLAVGCRRHQSWLGSPRGT